MGLYLMNLSAHKFIQLEKLNLIENITRYIIKQIKSQTSADPSFKL